MSRRAGSLLWSLVLIPSLVAAGCDQASNQEPTTGTYSPVVDATPPVDGAPVITAEEHVAQAGLPAVAVPENLTIRDAVVHLGIFGAAQDGRHFANHPVEVNLAVRLGSEQRSQVALVGLVADDAAQAAGSTCLLGSFELPSVGEKGAGEIVSFSREMVMPEACLGNAGERSFHPWVWLADTSEIAANGLLNDTIICDSATGKCSGSTAPQTIFLDDGEALPNRLEQANLAIFDDGHLLDARNQLCKGADGQAGCSTRVDVAQSPGLDVAFDSVEPTSTIAVNWSVFGHKDAAQIVPDPMLQVSSRLTLYGTGVAELHTDPLTGAYDTNADTLLPAPLDLTYDICPSDLGADCDGGEWAPLLVQTQGENQTATYAEYATTDRLTALSPRTLFHQLYPSAQATALLGADGAWRQSKHFTLRSCATPAKGFSEAGLDSDASANNCTMTDFVMIEPPAEYAEAVGKTWGGQFNMDGGGWVLKLEFRSGHVDAIDISGLHTDTWLNSRFTALGDVIDLKIVDLAHDADAFIDIINTGMDYHFEFMKTTYATYSNRLTTFQDPNLGKDAACTSNASCGNGNFPICTNYNQFGVGKCKRPCSDPSICRYGESCVAGECQFVGPAHLTYNWQHLSTQEWSKTWCKGFAWLIVVVIVGVDFCFGGSAGFGFEATVAGAHLCGEDQKADVCVSGKCYVGSKYCSPQDPASCGSCTTDAQCQCDPAKAKLPPIDITAGEYGNLRAPLRRMGYLEGSIFGIGTAFVEISGYASILVAKAGITAHLDLVKAKAPKFTGILIWATQALGKFLAYRIAVVLKVSIELNFLTGYIVAWAKLLLPYFCWKQISIPWLCCGKWSCSFCSKSINIPWLCFEWKEIWRAILASWGGIFKEVTLWEQPLLDESITIVPPGGSGTGQ